MSRVKSAGRELLNLKFDDETGLSHSCSVDAAVSRPDAVWVFPTGAVRGDGGVRANGVPLPREQQGDSGGGVRSAGAAVSTHLQDCAGTGDVECDRRAGGGAARRTVRIGETA